jgi:hypothetical protein
MASRTDIITPTKQSPSGPPPTDIQSRYRSEVIQSDHRSGVIQSKHRSEVSHSEQRSEVDQPDKASFEMDHSGDDSVDIEDDVVQVDDEVTLNFGDRSKLQTGIYASVTYRFFIKRSLC